MLLYVLLVAVLNLGLGFAVAVYLGRRHRLVAEAGGPWERDSEFTQPDWTTPPSEQGAAAGPDASAGPPSDQVVPPQLPIESGREKSPSETSVEDLKAGAQRYHGQLTQADEELRTQAESPDAAAIEACLDSLMKATEEYLEERREAYDRFKSFHHAQPEFSTVSDDLQVAIEQQDEQIDNAGAVIQAFDYRNNLEDGCRKMVGETGKLIEGSHQVRDTLDEAMVRVPRNEQRLGELHSATRNDPLTEIADRAGLQASLFEWWESDPQRVRQLCVAMIDIDYLTQINQEYGYRVGDRLLRTVAQFLKSECRGVGTVARFSGQRFLFLFPDTDIQVATKFVERVRQMIEMSHFHYHEFDIPVTVSCAVTGTTSEDTSDTLIARVEATLQEAKRYGRNRTFMHEGKYRTPVVPPNFSLEEKHITL